MAKRLGLRLVDRDFSSSEEKLRTSPPIEFEKLAVIVLCLGGIRNETQVGDYGINGKINHASASPKEYGKTKPEFGFIAVRPTVEVEQRDMPGSPGICDFEGVMLTHARMKCD